MPIRSIIFALVLLMSSSAYATDDRQRKAAVALAEQAAKAFQSADLDKAAKFYLEAARNDPDEPSYVYGAARAEQSAGQLDRAEKHYKQFIAAPSADPSRVAKAKANLNEIQHSRAETLGQEAETALQKRDFVLAASSWLEAYHLAPDRAQVLVKAALAEREAGDMPSAIKHLELFLRVTLPDAAERIKAEALLNQLRPGGSAPTVAPTAAPPPPQPPQPMEPRTLVSGSGAAPAVAVVTTPPQDHGNTAKIGLYTWIAGATVAAAGVGVFAWGLGEASDFQKQLADSDGAVHTTLSRDEALARSSTITTHQAIGATLAGVGVAATGVGLWLWLKDAPAASSAVIIPQSNGFSLVARF